MGRWLSRIAEGARVGAVREGVFATAVFAGILGFAMISLNYLISGGPDWNPGPPVHAIPSSARAAVTSLQRVDMVEPPPPIPTPDPVEFLAAPGPVGDLLGEPGAVVGDRGEPADDEAFNRAVDQLSARNAEAAEPPAPAPWAPDKPKPLASEY